MAKLLEALTQGWERIFDSDNSGPIASVKSTASSVATAVTQLAQLLQDMEGGKPGKEDKVGDSDGRIPWRIKSQYCQFHFETLFLEFFIKFIVFVIGYVVVSNLMIFLH